MAFGTLSILDTLAASQQTVAEYGEDRAFEQIDAALQAHNAQLTEMTDWLAETTTDRQRRYGTQDAMVMEDLDEFGAPDAQKLAAGATVGFPLRMSGIALQWTRSYFMRAQARELAAQVTGTLDADRLATIRAVKNALFGVANYTFVDRLIDNVDLAVKRLVNADSASIPLGPNGESFDGASHTHYVARVGALAASDISGVIRLVAEHFAQGDTVLLINQASEAAVRGFTSNFTPYVDARIIPAQNVQVARTALAVNNIYDRPIGIFDTAEVQVKPWIPANYMVAIQRGVEKPLVRRIDPVAGDGLLLVAEDERHPLRARTWERRHGFGVWNRTAAAILYTGGTSYVVPTIT
ncbi:MAG: hypothetical protein ACSLE9_08040 [Burkholderiaceae bacterium]